MRFWQALPLLFLLNACDPAWGISRTLQMDRIPDPTCVQEAIRSLPDITSETSAGRTRTINFKNNDGKFGYIRQEENTIILHDSALGTGFRPDDTEVVMRAAIAMEEVVATQCHVAYSNIHYECLIGLLEPSGPSDHAKCQKAYPGLVYLESLNPSVAGTPLNNWADD